MLNAIALLLILLATASEVFADDRIGPARRLHLAAPELFALLPVAPFTQRAGGSLTGGGLDRWEQTAGGGLLDHRDRHAGGGLLDRNEDLGGGLPPFFTLVAPPAPASGDGAEAKPPLLAFGARMQGRTLVAFTRPGTKVDPDDRVVYQRLVISDLFEGRRFSVTVYEDHALGSSDSQVLGFGARLMLRPALEVGGWRARVELFASYDMTLGAMGYIGVTARAPTPPSLRVP